MLTIHKFSLGNVPGVASVMMPAEAKVLHIRERHGQVTLWAELDASEVMFLRNFYIVGTGNPLAIPGNVTYLGTALLEPFVWHVYG